MISCMSSNDSLTMLADREGALFPNAELRNLTRFDISATDF